MDRGRQIEKPRTMRTISVRMLGLFSGVVLSGCVNPYSPNAAYSLTPGYRAETANIDQSQRQTANRDLSSTIYVVPDVQYRVSAIERQYENLAVIPFDDQGELNEDEQEAMALQKLRTKIDGLRKPEITPDGKLQTGAVVRMYFYVHGWSEDAILDSAIAARFSAFVRIAGEEKGVKSLGVLIAWRGRSGEPIVGPNWLAAPTFWERKNVSSRVASLQMMSVFMDAARRLKDDHAELVITYVQRKLASLGNSDHRLASDDENSEELKLLRFQNESVAALEKVSEKCSVTLIGHSLGAFISVQAIAKGILGAGLAQSSKSERETRMAIFAKNAQLTLLNELNDGSDKESRILASRIHDLEVKQAEFERATRRLAEAISILNDFKIQAARFDTLKGLRRNLTEFTALDDARSDLYNANRLSAWRNLLVLKSNADDIQSIPDNPANFVNNAKVSWTDAISALLPNSGTAEFEMVIVYELELLRAKLEDGFFLEKWKESLKKYGETALAPTEIKIAAGKLTTANDRVNEWIRALDSIEKLTEKSSRTENGLVSYFVRQVAALIALAESPPENACIKNDQPMLASAFSQAGDLVDKTNNEIKHITENLPVHSSHVDALGRQDLEAVRRASAALQTFVAFIKSWNPISSKYAGVKNHAWNIWTDDYREQRSLLLLAMKGLSQKSSLEEEMLVLERTKEIAENDAKQAIFSDSDRIALSDARDNLAKISEAREVRNVTKDSLRQDLKQLSNNLNRRICDLVVLINPALNYAEVSELRSEFSVRESSSESPLEKLAIAPSFVVLCANHDWVIERMFRASLEVDSWFSHYRSQDRRNAWKSTVYNNHDNLFTNEIVLATEATSDSMPIWRRVGPLELGLQEGARYLREVEILKQPERKTGFWIIRDRTGLIRNHADALNTDFVQLFINLELMVRRSNESRKAEQTELKGSKS